MGTVQKVGIGLLAALALVWAVSPVARAQTEPARLPESESAAADRAALDEPTPSAAWVEPDPLAPVLRPYRDLQSWLANEANFELELGYTAVFQWADDVADDTHTLLSGSYDVAGLWTPIDDERWGVGQLGLLVEGGQVISHREDEDLSANVGSAFGINDDFDNTDIAVTELWWAHALFEERLVVTVGKIDQTVFFDTNRIANDETAQFLATPLVNNPAVAFPDNGLGANVTVQATDWLYVMGGLGDAKAVADESGFNTIDGDELFYAGEVGVTVEPFDRPGTYRVMGWASEGEDGTDGSGVAVSIDQELLADGLVAFGRYGAGDEQMTDFEQFASAGVGFEGPLGKTGDLIAVGYTWGRVSGDEETEQLIEAFYRMQVTDTLALTPDVQFIVDPAGRVDEDAVTVFGLRLQATF